MKIQRKKCIHILLLTVSMIGVLTVLFFTGESLLGGGWYYIPDRAITVALVFCIFWQIALITGTFFLSMRVNKIFCGWRKRIVMIPMVAAAAFLFLFLAWNWLLYSFQFEEKVEQYDEHIALYVNNTFARTRFRYPHYMYEENWLFMRNLDDEEQQEAVLKYGDPDNYYND